MGVVETYDRSVHGRALADGNPQAPVCTDCHTGHQITRASTPQHHLDIVAECGDCHDPHAAQAGNHLSDVEAGERAQPSDIGLTKLEHRDTTARLGDARHFPKRGVAIGNVTNAERDAAAVEAVVVVGERLRVSLFEGNTL